MLSCPLSISDVLDRFEYEAEELQKDYQYHQDQDEYGCGIYEYEDRWGNYGELLKIKWWKSFTPDKRKELVEEHAEKLKI